MNLLSDTDLLKLLANQPSKVISGVDLKSPSTQVHGCTVELRIGEIFQPGAEEGKLGSAAKPRDGLTLAEGETAVVRTIESFKLSDSQTAFVFPVSKVSLQGLLMTNPGQVDPGYDGPLHVTVINMGREGYRLEKGNRFLRAVIFNLDNPVTTPYVPKAGAVTPITDELLQTLSPDFLSVSARGAAAAKKEIDSAMRTNALWQFAFPAVVAAIAACASAYITNWSLSEDFEDRIAGIENRTKEVNAELRLLKLEGDFPTEKRLNTLEGRLQSLESKRK